MLRLTALLVALAVIRALPVDYLDDRPRLCLLYNAVGRTCPGCGMTRALWRLAHGDVEGALRANWRVAVVTPVLVLWYVQGFDYTKAKPPEAAEVCVHISN